MERNKTVSERVGELRVVEWGEREIKRKKEQKDPRSVFFHTKVYFSRREFPADSLYRLHNMIDVHCAGNNQMRQPLY